MKLIFNYLIFFFFTFMFTDHNIVFWIRLTVAVYFLEDSVFPNYYNAVETIS